MKPVVHTAMSTCELKNILVYISKRCLVCICVCEVSDEVYKKNSIENSGFYLKRIHVNVPEPL